jgi:hypothetical protein
MKTKAMLLICFMVPGGYGLAQTLTGYDNIVIGSDSDAGAITSSILGGEENEIPDAEDSFIGGGYENRILGAQSENSVVCGGYRNTILTNGCVIAGGYNNEVGGYWSAIGGGYRNTNDSWIGTIGGGLRNRATGPLATIPGGFEALAPSFGQVAHANGGFTYLALGEAQTSEYIARRTSTNSSETELLLNGDPGSDGYNFPAQRMFVPTDATWVFDVTVIARNAKGDCGAFRTNGAIKNVLGTLSLVGVPVGKIKAQPVVQDVPAWTVNVSADNANKALAIKANGDDSTIRWVATIRTTEVLFSTANPSPRRLLPR